MRLTVGIPIRLLLAASAGLLTGCVHVVPVPHLEDSRDSKALAKVLVQFSPQARELLEKERDVANELKVTLDESEHVAKEDFRRRFESYADSFIAIRNQRRKILLTILQITYTSPMVLAFQKKTVQLVNDEVKRTDSWVRSAQNVKLRSELGRQTDFPEYAALNQQLQGFLSLTQEDSISMQLWAVVEEFRLSENDLK